MMKKFISRAAVLLLAFMLFSLASCARVSVPEDTAAETEAPPAGTELFAGGVCNFKVIRPENATDNEIAAAQEISKAIGALCGKNAALATDFIKNDGSYDASAMEILVGMTNRPETASALEKLTYGEYAVSLSGNKIVIAAWQDIALPTAANVFCKTASKLFNDRKDSEDSVYFMEEDSQILTASPALKALPSYEGGKLSSVDNGGDGVYSVYITKTDKAEFDSYLEKLSANGYEKVSEREAAGNVFVGFTGKEYGVYAYYMPAYGAVRAIINPSDTLYAAPVSGSAAEKVCEPRMTMIGRRFSTTSTYLGVDSGAGLMSFVLRLSDGSFIVIDGGVATDAFADAIMSTLKEQAPDSESIVISAWIITHTHSDHTGGFIKFTAKYAVNVKLLSLVCNFPPKTVTDANKETANANSVMTSLKSYPGAAIYKAHNGQVFVYGDTSVEFLYSPEDYYMQDKALTDYNNTSLAFRVDIAGQKLMFLGDASQIANGTIVKLYGGYIKSDIVQIAHHGGVAGIIDVYRNIDAYVLLFTTSDALLPKYLQFDYNHYAAYELHAEEIVNAADRIYEFPLPYKANSGLLVKKK